MNPTTSPPPELVAAADRIRKMLGDQGSWIGASEPWREACNQYDAARAKLAAPARETLEERVEALAGSGLRLSESYAKLDNRLRALEALRAPLSEAERVLWETPTEAAERAVIAAAEAWRVHDKTSPSANGGIEGHAKASLEVFNRLADAIDKLASARARRENTEQDGVAQLDRAPTPGAAQAVRSEVAGSNPAQPASPPSPAPSAPPSRDELLKLIDTALYGENNKPPGGHAIRATDIAISLYVPVLAARDAEIAALKQHAERYLMGREAAIERADAAVAERDQLKADLSACFKAKNTVIRERDQHAAEAERLRAELATRTEEVRVLSKHVEDLRAAPPSESGAVEGREDREVAQELYSTWGGDLEDYTSEEARLWGNVVRRARTLLEPLEPPAAGAVEKAAREIEALHHSGRYDEIRCLLLKHFPAPPSCGIAPGDLNALISKINMQARDTDCAPIVHKWAERLNPTAPSVRAVTAEMVRVIDTDASNAHGRGCGGYFEFMADALNHRLGAPSGGRTGTGCATVK